KDQPTLYFRSRPKVCNAVKIPIVIFFFLAIFNSVLAAMVESVFSKKRLALKNDQSAAGMV
ncbi:hypothetical protein, partial [Piscirickettsia salmonis]